MMMLPRHPASLIILALSMVMFLPLLIGIGSDSIGSYDESVFYGSASALARDRPYEDFLVLHPPGIVLVSALGIRMGMLAPAQRIALRSPRWFSVPSFTGSPCTLARTNPTDRNWPSSCCSRRRHFNLIHGT